MDNSVEILKEDFIAVDYTDSYDCALARALKRKFPERDIIAGSEEFLINADYYKFSTHDDNIIMDICNGNKKPQNLTVKYFFRFRK